MSTQRPDLVTILESTALLAGLSPEELRTLAARAARKRFSAGELLFSEGEPCHGLHIIASGEETQIVFISQRDFHGYCLEHPQVALKMLSVVGARLRRLVDIIEELSFTTIRQRLVATLLKLAQTEGATTARGIEFQLPSTHQELANQLGTVRELISRNLMRLQAEGLVEVDARRIIVKDMKGLSALLNSPR